MAARTASASRPFSASGPRRPQAAQGRDVQVEHRSDLVAKVRERRGLYLNPPSERSCSSVDEKTQIQALDRTAPMLPMRPGQVERIPTTTNATAPRVSSPR